MEYMILTIRSLMPSFWVDIAVNPAPFILGLFALLTFFWMLHRA